MTKYDLLIHGIVFLSSKFDNEKLTTDDSKFFKDVVESHIYMIEQDKKIPYKDMVKELECNLLDEISYWVEDSEMLIGCD